MKILFAASEAVPFFSSGGLGEVAGSLPAALRKCGADIRVILPLYGDMGAAWRERLRYVTNFTVPVGWRNQYCGLFEFSAGGVAYYFLDNEYYFKRGGLYGFYDDGERFAFFSRAVLETLIHIDFSPEIIHCNDWQTALVPVYLNLYYRHMEQYAHLKTVFTVHNLQYQGKYGGEILEETIGVSRGDAHILEYDGIVNFMKGAVETADRVSTVSPTYAGEILEPWFGHGLDGFLREKRYKLCGILNGIDTAAYDPAADPGIACRYTADTAEEGKAACKRELQDELGLEQSGAPLIGMVSRMADHKGFDLVRHVADSLLDDGFQLAVLGSGDAAYEEFFADLAFRRRGLAGAHIGFVPTLARKIYAGADMFLMPSKSEPCGLAQMVALRYGTVPVVRETGGLRDTVRDAGGEGGNGFTFAGYNAYDMRDACLRARDAHQNREGWAALRARAMACDFSWDVSAARYAQMYADVAAMW